MFVKSPFNASPLDVVSGVAGSCAIARCWIIAPAGWRICGAVRVGVADAPDHDRASCAGILISQIVRELDERIARRAAGLSEVQEGWDTPGCHAAPACAAPATYAAGKLNAKLKSDFRCHPNNGHAATASAGPFCARKRLMHCNNARWSSSRQESRAKCEESV